MLFKNIIRAGLIALLASPTFAQNVSECDWVSGAQNIPEPWEQNTQTFSNGQVRLALLDTVEPAAAAFYLLIISPPLDEVGAPQCRVIGRDTGMGYAGISFQELSADYEASRGLIFQVPATIYLPEEDDFSNSAKLEITLNQATGEITVEQFLAE